MVGSIEYYFDSWYYDVGNTFQWRKKMSYIRIITCFALLTSLTFSNALGQSELKIGVAVVDVCREGNSFPVYKENDSILFRQAVSGFSRHIAADFADQVEGASVRELPFQVGWGVKAYRDLAVKEELDVLLFYDIQCVPGAKAGVRPPIVDDFLLDGQLMLLQTGDTWGRASTEHPGDLKFWIAKLAGKAGDAVQVRFRVRSNPSDQICRIDGEVKGSTPQDFSAFRVVGNTVKIQIHFDNPKGVCRRKDTRVKYHGQIIDTAIVPEDPESPPCRSNE